MKRQVIPIGIPRAKPGLEISGLRKRFGRHQVLDGVDLRAERGRITGLLGPNASGKTTVLKAVVGLVRPDEGEIRVLGEQVSSDPGYRARIGYMPQRPAFPVNLTAREVLSLLRDLRGVERPATDESLVEALRLSTEMDKPLGMASGGTAQKVNALVAFLFRPDLLILDEPTAGLDPAASAELKDRLWRERDLGRTVLITSHVLAELEELVDDVVFLLEGRVRFQGGLRELVSLTGESGLERAVGRLIREEEGKMGGAR